MNNRVVRLSPDNTEDFYRVHAGECGWCYCTAWWQPSWEGWTERSDSQNREDREELIRRGEYDGYLLYVDDTPAGWSQVGRRDRLTKLVTQYKLEPDSEVWAITCFVIRPEYRRRGLADQLLKGILEDLRQRGVKTVQAFPRRTDSKEPGEHWKGPESLYLGAGFKVKRESDVSPVLELQFY